ncbi:M1 family metallopeptidase [Streptomyces platensis]|uniref:M1 family metallopeptidase n=1 Tax=Streptomyces platensis TaxID=58346 RepID=UPI002E80BFFF|nr:M1 family metallopeptidase [Streptomyces platensis]WTI53848.1 M1 family metallopeptidase [Streptomyces platensis]WUB80558.1 M1 family metallopeptidase [Streptomyces platensis]
MSADPGSAVNRRPLRSCGATAALSVALLLSACTSSGVRGAAGSGGVGDPLFPSLGNGGYQVRHYGLDLDYDIKKRHLDATADLTAVAKTDLGSFQLDLQGLRVTEVQVDGEKAEFSRKGHKLTVRPAEGLRKGAEFRTRVDYNGTPQEMKDPDQSTEGWVKTRDGAFVSGEPAGSMTWFPGNNHPADKATYDFTITVPKGYTAVANGELRSERTAKGRTTFRWHSGRPMASYLATATIGRFEVRTSRTPEGLPLYVAVDPAEAKASKGPLEKLPEIVKWETKLFGPYPFASAGAIVDDTPKRIDWLALESQTKPVYAGAPDTVTLVHEMAHQWFGDSVTPKTWADTWLSESVATYAEWLWEEREGGKTPQQQFDALYKDTTDPDRWAFPPGKPGQAKNVTGTPVYERGAMLLQELRNAVGDKTFFTILREWPAEYRYRNADAQDFIDFCQERTDVDLEPLFKKWLYEKGKPERED